MVKKKDAIGHTTEEGGLKNTTHSADKEIEGETSRVSSVGGPKITMLKRETTSTSRKGKDRGCTGPTSQTICLLGKTASVKNTTEHTRRTLREWARKRVATGAKRQ